MIGTIQLVAFGAVIWLTWTFFRSASTDADTWTTAYDRLAHPYSKKSQALCLVWFVGIFAVLFLFAFTSGG